MFDPAGIVTLDDVTIAEIEQELDAPVVLAETAPDLAAVVRGLAETWGGETTCAVSSAM
jgi:hypothetical protein